MPFLSPSSAIAGDGCLGEEALSSRDLGQIHLSDPVLPLGSWKLPVSPTRPAQVSAAEVKSDLIEHPGKPGSWDLRFEFSFIDPDHAWGIPYSFQKIRVSWEDGSNGSRSRWIDWSGSCSKTGRALYPGQAWTVSEELPEWVGSDEIQDLRLEIFGSRD